LLFIKKHQNKLIAVFLVSVLFLCLFYNFFIIGKYSSYPWWHCNGSDGDGSFPAQSIAILNNEKITVVQHPAATLHIIHAVCYKLLSFFDASHKKLSTLHEIYSNAGVWDIMEVAVRTSRVLTLFLAMIFIALFFTLIYWFTKSWFISFLISFYLLTAGGFIIHSYWIRPELLSIMFLFIVFVLALRNYSGKNVVPNNNIRDFCLWGFLLGMAILSKIQIIPVILCFVLCLFVLSFRNKIIAEPRTEDVLKTAKSAIFLNLINIVIMPWWAIKRPTFLTEEVLAKMPLFRRETYGTMPDNFYWLFIVIFVILILISLGIFYFAVKSNRKILAGLLAYNIQAVNCLIFGIIVSIYLVFIPAISSFENYLFDTHNLLYSMLTNVIGGAHIESRFSIVQNFNRIVHLHKASTLFLIFNMFYLAIFFLIISVFRLLQKNGKFKNYYCIVLFLVLAGIFSDYISALRKTPRHYIYNYYVIYSLCLYALSFALIISLEIKQLFESHLNNKIKVIIKYFIFGMLILHACLMLLNYLKKDKASGISEQDHYLIYNTMRNVEPFWEVVDRNSKNKLAEEKPAGILKDVISRKPNNIENYIALGQGYLKNKKYLEALDILSEAVTVDPQNAFGHYLLAETQVLLGEITSAIVSVNKSIVFFKMMKNEEGFKRAVILRRIIDAEIKKEIIPQEIPAQEMTGNRDGVIKLSRGKEISFIKSSSAAEDIYAGKVRRWSEENIIDGKAETHWCTADNVREWAYISLDKDYMLSRIGFVNGNGSWKISDRYYYDARVKEVRIELSNGWTKDIQLKDHGEFQYFDIDKQKTDYVKITVLSLYPRKVWSHSCLSEVEIFAQK